MAACSNNRLVLYTDGSAHYKTKCGGWAYCIVRDRRLIRQMSGASGETTVNRMELQAAIEALSFAAGSALLRRGEEVVLNSDSKYVVDYLAEDHRYWWVQANFRTAANEPVKNQDLWQLVEQALQRLEARGVTVKFHWVRGHNGNYYNEQCDKLAGNARLRYEQRRGNVQAVPAGPPPARPATVPPVPVPGGERTGPRPRIVQPVEVKQRSAWASVFD